MSFSTQFNTSASPQLTSTGVRLIEHNKQMHIKYGNIKKFIRIAQWNKGNSYIVNMIERLKETMAKHKPERFVIFNSIYSKKMMRQY